MKGEDEYYRIHAKKAVIATGAQERMLPFPNNDIPGVVGAGAVQTLMAALLNGTKPIIDPTIMDYHRFERGEKIVEPMVV